MASAEDVLRIPSRKEMIPPVAKILPVFDLFALLGAVFLFWIGLPFVAIFLIVFVGFGGAIDAYFTIYFMKQRDFFRRVMDLSKGPIFIKRVDRDTFATGSTTAIAFWKGQRDQAFSRYTQTTSVFLAAMTLYAVSIPTLWVLVVGSWGTGMVSFTLIGASTFAFGFILLLIVLITRDASLQEDTRYLLMANIPEEEEALSMAKLMKRTESLFKCSNQFKLLYMLMALRDIERTGSIVLTDKDGREITFLE